MILLEVGNLLGLVVGGYIILHLPAIITLIMGLTRLKKKPESAKKLLIFSIVYFIIGAGICGAMFM